MELLLSNFPPVVTRMRTFQEAFYDLLPKADQLNIAVGYVTADSLLELKRIIELNRIEKVRLLIGMHGADKFTRQEYDAAIDLGAFLEKEIRGEVLLITSFRFHGKMYAFSRDRSPFAAIVGSNNLSSIVRTYNRVYEASILVEDTVILEETGRFIDNLCNSAAEKIADAEISSFNDDSFPLENHDYVEHLNLSQSVNYVADKSEITFDIPIKTESRSGLNVYFGKGRENKKTKVVKPRHWYEVEIIVPKEITEHPEYPKAKSSTAVFDVVTDDGWKFKCKVSGDYSKNLRSENDLKVLGMWLKGRLEVRDLKQGEPVTDEVLESYGRKSFSMTKLKSGNIWFLDFGVR